MGYCGCWWVPPKQSIFGGMSSRVYLPLVDMKAHAQVLSTASRTKLTQTFVNNTSAQTPEVRYSFPLYDGVSVVSFKCIVGDKVMVGSVKEKYQARAQYEDAVAKGQSAGLLEQNHEASDVFSTRIGNIPKDGKAIVEIEYVGELKHDTQLDSVRFSIPTSIAPRYGMTNSLPRSPYESIPQGNIEVTVDVEVDEGANIKSLSSPSHPIAMTMGRTTTKNKEFKSNRASATLSLGQAELADDFVVVINAQDHAIPRALLEHHPDMPQHRALMTTLVPKFNLPNIHPEIVFVVDRSGSMNHKMFTVIQALKIFLKSLPLSVKFNICSFGSDYSFLFPRSVPYDETSLQNALNDVQNFAANYGGTELLRPLQETVKNRLQGVPLEIMVLTDGEIWNQQETFNFVNKAVEDNIRLFSLGIGRAASTSLVEGLARAGNGFAQFAKDNEMMDKRVMRMLKAALSPHIVDYKMEVNYERSQSEDEEDFEMVEPVQLVDRTRKPHSNTTEKKDVTVTPISLFDQSFTEAAISPPAGRYDHLPTLHPPSELQAPNNISGVFSYNRVCAYILLPDSSRKIKSIMLKGTYNNTPLQLEIPVQDVGLGKTVHQLAAKKAMLEIEEGRGWLSSATTSEGTLLQMKHASDWSRIVEREAVRVGVTYQIAGKHCSFVATERDLDDIQEAESGHVLKHSDPHKQRLRRSAGLPQRTISPSQSASVSANPSAVRPSQLAQPHSEFDSMTTFVSPFSAPPLPSSTQTTGGLFGNNSRASCFGTQSLTNHTSTNLFGSGTTNAFGSGTTSLFGSSATTSLGQPPNPHTGSYRMPQPGGLFGSSSTVPHPGISPSVPQSMNCFDYGATTSATALFGAPASSSIAKSFSPRSPDFRFGSHGSSGLAFKNSSNQVGFGASATIPSGTLQSYSGTSSASPATQGHSGSLFGQVSRANVAQNSYGIHQRTPTFMTDVAPYPPHGGGFGSGAADSRFMGLSHTTADTVEAKTRSVIELQAFDGRWTPLTKLLQLIDVSKEVFNDTTMLVEDENARATILAIAWLEKVAYKEMEVWEMVADKARQWLTTNHGITDIDTMVKRAIAILFA